MAKKPKYSIQDAGTGKSIADLLNKTYSGRPLDYEGVFKNAYENLGQQYNPTASKVVFDPKTGAATSASSGPSGQQDVAVQGTKNLAGAFIERYYQQFGQLPDEATIKDFVGQNLNSRYASEYIVGLPADQLNSTIVDPYIKGNMDDIAPPGTEGPSADQTLQDQLNRYYDEARTGLASKVEDAYNPSKEKLVNELAASGTLSSPVSRYSLNQLEGDKNRALTQAYGTLAESQAKGQLGVADTNARLAENARQFNQNSLFDRNKLNEDIFRYDQGLGMQRQQMDLASQLGRAQADASGPSALDWTNTALTGASILAAPFTAGTSLAALPAITAGGAGLAGELSRQSKQPPANSLRASSTFTPRNPSYYGFR